MLVAIYFGLLKFVLHFFIAIALLTNCFYLLKVGLNDHFQAIGLSLE